MPHDLRPYAPTDAPILRALTADASIAPQFDKFQGEHGLEHKLADPRLDRDALRLAFVDGEPAGFGLAWKLPAGTGHWAMLRVAVREPYRRRGLGAALAREVIAHLDRTASGPLELAGSAWMPSEAAERLAAKLGGEHERWFWMMERPRGAVSEPTWPAGVTTRTFDGSETLLNEWTDVYNDSFARHYRWVRADVAITRQLVTDPTFRADGLVLAYRGGRCVGFCRNELHATRGEIGTLGVAHDARGIGLGRALLRWGVGWLERATPLPVTLLVDGENEGALQLYRSEGFAVARTRRIWALPRSR